MQQLSRQNISISRRYFKMDTGSHASNLVCPGLQGAHVGGVSPAGTRPTFSATATAKCSTNPQSLSRPKEESKLGALDFIFQPDLYPDLYKDIYHKVRINYYPPRGDNKEGWDKIHIFRLAGLSDAGQGVDRRCDSILRLWKLPPPGLDGPRVAHAGAQEPGNSGVARELLLQLRMTAEGLYPEHDFFIQPMKLKNTLRHVKAQDFITHLGLEYYGRQESPAPAERSRSCRPGDSQT